MDGLLFRMHSAMAVQTKLANTSAILSMYLHHLSLKTEMKLFSSLLSTVMKEQAEAAGNAIASFWRVRRTYGGYSLASNKLTVTAWSGSLWSPLPCVDLRMLQQV